MDSLPG
jgi:hypothetical protein